MSSHSRYTILRKIADGGTAEIFLAKQTGAQGFEKMVVLKRIFNSFYSDPQFKHMLVDEAHIAMSLYHSNIVQVLDLGEADGRHFLALELVDGWTLDEVLKRAKAAGVPFPPALALYVTAEICRALAYAHSKARDGAPLGIVHRDISPHNVLLSEHGEVKLTDFGIAKAHNKQEQSQGNMIKGKIAFMSPEQASGQDLDARSDLFSLGTMLYMMIARRAPFDAPTDFETLMQVRSGDFIPPESVRPGLNPEIYRVMRKAMGKTPAERYQQAGEMLVDVEQVMRIAFRAVGQTELARWLTDLGAKDGVPPLTRANPPAVNDTVVMDRPPVPSSEEPPAVSSDTESSVELDLDGPDAVLVTSPNLEPPPPPPSTSSSRQDSRSHVTSLRPVPFWTRRSFRKNLARAGAAAVLVLLAVVALKTVKARRTAVQAAGPAATPVVASPVVARPAVLATPEPIPSPPASAMAAADAARSASETAADARAPTSATTKVSETKAAETKAAETKTAAAIAENAPPAAAPGDEPEPEDQPDTRSEPAVPSEPARGNDDKTAPKKQVSVSIKTDPEGSTVSTRHHSFGATPIALKLRPGNSYELTFTKAGYLPSTKVVRIANTTRSIRVALKRAPANPHPAAAAEANPPDSSASKKSWWKLHFSR